IDTGDHVERRGLSCSVRADQGDDLPFVDLQGKIIHSHHAAELHRGIFHSQYVLTHLACASFSLALLRLLHNLGRSDSSWLPIRPSRRNSTTSMITTENTTIRKPPRRIFSPPML